MGKFIDFIITQKCNQNCLYCSQSKLEQEEKNHASSEIIDCFLKFIKTLDREFEITITGGEAILHPRFFEIIEKVANLGFKINLISNFSFQMEIYHKIFKITENKLNRLDISLHLDEIKDFNLTIEKLKQFLSEKPKQTKTNILIPIFKLTEKKEKEIIKIKSIAYKYNTNVSFQHVRILNQYIKYNKKEQSYFLDQENSKKTYAHLCQAGQNSAVIYEDGSVYRCYSSRFSIKNYLGNIKNKNFKLKNKPQICTQKFCTCPKPKQYNQIEQQKNYIIALKDSFINSIFLPILTIKQIKILKRKLRQSQKIN